MGAQLNSFDTPMEHIVLDIKYLIKIDALGQLTVMYEEKKKFPI